MIDELIKSYYSDYSESIRSWVDEEYDKKFSKYFSKVKSSYSGMSKFSDDDLEWILTMLPIDLMSASEDLNNVKSECAIAKLRQKEIKSNLINNFDPDVKISKSELLDRIDVAMVQHKVVVAALESLIRRVESDISFSKELIMGCKKIWDSRRYAEKPAVGEVIPESAYDLPDYEEVLKGQYIK